MSTYVADISTVPHPERINFDCDGVLVDSEPNHCLGVLGELIVASGLEMRPWKRYKPVSRAAVLHSL